MKPYDKMTGGAHQQVADFISISIYGTTADWGKYSTIAFWDSRGIKVAMLYNHFLWPDCCMNVAARPGALWAHPQVLWHAFTYPFEQLKCRRVTGLTSVKRKEAVKTNDALGFVREGLLRNADPEGGDVILYGMLREECRWLNYQERKAA